MIKLKKLMGEGTKPPSPMHNEARRHFLEVISTYKAFGRKLQAEHDLAEIANTSNEPLSSDRWSNAIAQRTMFINNISIVIIL